MATPSVLMPPVDPDLHSMLAKSDPRESLVDHTWSVLSRLADQLKLRPYLPAQLGDDRLWQRLFWSCFIHDFGKAARGFQDVLIGSAKKWPYRHEALSLAFVDWLVPPGHSDRAMVIAMVACHHKDVDVIVSDYSAYDDLDEDLATKLLPQIDSLNRERLYWWLQEYAMSWAEALGFSTHLEGIDLPSLAEALRQVNPQTVHHAVRDLRTYTKSLSLTTNAALWTEAMLLRGLILTADHAGSAHTAPYPQATLPRDRILSGVRELYPHQEGAANAPTGSALLIGPTSSGKTEAALYWVARQSDLDGTPPARLFYALPYQASMNAMWSRLKGIFPSEQVGLQHGRALFALYRSALEAEADVKHASMEARTHKDLAKLNFYPVRVFSPYQMLEAPYCLKGYEMLLADYYNGLFIFDEIHAYDTKRLALIVTLMRLLNEHFRARFFIMTATLPPLVHEVLRQAIPDLYLIEAGSKVFAQFQRHRVHILESALLDPEICQRIAADVRSGRTVLVCCNLVRRASHVFETLSGLLSDLPAEDLILVHSRFNAEDRLRKEGQIQQSAGVGNKQDHPLLVVATQVVEVSLNIDLDTLYTDPAPLEALLQRFGRVNRGRRLDAPLADVHVMSQSDENDHYVYDPDLVQAALHALKTVDGYPVDESMVSEWLGAIYSGSIAEAWQKDYDQAAKEFWDGVICAMHPFQSALPEEARRFYELFDGAEVLPVCLEPEFEKRREQGDYIGATALLVPVAWRDVARLMRLSLGWPKEDSAYYVVNVPYDPDLGLDLETAYSIDKAERRAD